MIERVPLATNIVQKHRLHLPLCSSTTTTGGMQVLPGAGDEDSAFAFEFLDRVGDAGPRLSQFLDGQAALGRVATEEDDQVGFRVEDKVGLQEGARRVNAKVAFMERSGPRERTL